MIIVQDRIEVRAGDRVRLQQRFADDYAPAAGRRGLAFEAAWTSPPVDLVDQPVTLWLRWRVPDVPSWWAMRSAASDPAVAGFWASVEPLIVARERRYLVAEPRAAEATWPAPIDTKPFEVEPRGWRETAQLHLPAGAASTAVEALADGLAAAGAALPGVEGAWIGINFVPDYGAGHLTWDLLFPDRESATAARRSAVWSERIAPSLARSCTRWTALGLETVGAGLSRPDLRDGVKRTALFRALPDVDRTKRVRWERDLLEMPAHVPAIVNWRLSRAVVLDWSSADAPAWTHVWEQEYERLEGLTVDYMVHPHHWAHVDRWFDPESGDQIIDTALCHAYCPLPRTILGREAGADVVGSSAGSA